MQMAPLRLGAALCVRGALSTVAWDEQRLSEPSCRQSSLSLRHLVARVDRYTRRKGEIKGVGDPGLVSRAVLLLPLF